MLLKMDDLLEKVNIMEISIKRFNDRISSVEQAVDKGSFKMYKLAWLTWSTRSAWSTWG